MAKEKSGERNSDTKGNKYRIEKSQTKIKAEIMADFIKCRKEKHITQQMLAERTGIARPNIARMENGSYNPTVDMLVRIADGIGMKIEIKWIDK